MTMERERRRLEEAEAEAWGAHSAAKALYEVESDPRGGGSSPGYRSQLHAEVIDTERSAVQATLAAELARNATAAAVANPGPPAAASTQPLSQAKFWFLDEVETHKAVSVVACRLVSDALHRELSLIHISEPTRLLSISYAVFCLKKKKNIYSYNN
eukprot:TRINITY_DN26895_c0_g1_i2.p1 TRINITY_DN26895_c0_g1~~TRINITY_DN26895_c0_g1_i2.p1  ORF type:complete len:156 (+),score=32.18 TRINITY_DN26895_c0_g1_i2:225-692(+)